MTLQFRTRRDPHRPRAHYEPAMLKQALNWFRDGRVVTRNEIHNFIRFAREADPTLVADAVTGEPLPVDNLCMMILRYLKREGGASMAFAEYQRQSPRPLAAPATPRRLRRRYTSYRPQFDAAIMEFYRTHKLTHGSTILCVGHIEALHPEYLTDAISGERLPHSRLLQHIQSVAVRTLAAKNGEAQVAASSGAELAAHAARSLDLAAKAIAKVSELARAGKTETLEAILSLME